MKPPPVKAEAAKEKVADSFESATSGGDGGILPRAKQQPSGLIACGLRTAALFSSSPS